MQLSDIATVRSGLVLSRKQARNTFGVRYPLLNLRSINPKGVIDMDKIDVFDAVESLSEDYLSQVSDIIVRLSDPYTAVLIDEKTMGMVISSNFVIIRCDNMAILPEYLHWLINSPKMKKSIYVNSTSNMLGSINAKYFSEYKLDSLAVADQRRIAAMNSLALKESNLLFQLSLEKERYYKLLIQNTYEEMKRGNYA